MKIHLIKKEKGRVYKSEDIVRALFGIELEHDAEGAPVLRLAEDAAGADPARYISISDTKNYWACAVEPFRIGIDMEEAGRIVRPQIARRMHKEEQAYLAVLSEGGREWSEEFLSIWTRKEAWSKYCGRGLGMSFSEFSVLGGALPAPASSLALSVPALPDNDASSGSDPYSVSVDQDAVQAEDMVPVRSFVFKNLVFGIAGDESADIVFEQYDAPMEKSALDFAAGLLDVRAFSSAALKARLTDYGYRESEADAAIEKLKDYGYINDESYAAELARRSAESGKGSRRISFELKEKGIDKELAGRTASEYKEGEYARALSIARKMSESSGFSLGSGPASQPDPEDLSSVQKKALYSRRQKFAGKVSRKLASLGYDAPVIYSVLEDLGF